MNLPVPQNAKKSVTSWGGGGDTVVQLVVAELSCGDANPVVTSVTNQAFSVLVYVC